MESHLRASEGSPTTPIEELESVREGGGLLDLKDIGEKVGREGREEREWSWASEERRGREREPLLAERERDGVVGRGRRDPRDGVVGRPPTVEGVVGRGSRDDGVVDLQEGRDGVLDRPQEGVIGRGKRQGVELLIVVNEGVELLIVVRREGVELRLPTGVLLVRSK